MCFRTQLRMAIGSSLLLFLPAIIWVWFLTGSLNFTNGGILNGHFVTDKDKGIAELENPAVLIVESKIENIRKIQGVLEYVIKNNKPLLIIADVEAQDSTSFASANPLLDLIVGSGFQGGPVLAQFGSTHDFLI